MQARQAEAQLQARKQAEAQLQARQAEARGAAQKSEDIVEPGTRVINIASPKSTRRRKEAVQELNLDAM
jgi:hypothetical protein